MAFVLAVEAREGERGVVGNGGGCIGARVILRWGERREVGARSRAGFIRAVRAVTVVIVDAREGDGDAGIRDAGEGGRGGRLEELGN